MFQLVSFFAKQTLKTTTKTFDNFNNIEENYQQKFTTELLVKYTSSSTTDTAAKAP